MSDKYLVKGYELKNPEKVDRAIYGQAKGDGSKIGGVAGEDGTYDEDALLAEYDRIGGPIFRGTDKVVTGSFYDFQKKAPREKPEVKFVFSVNGKFVEVPDGKELPGEVKAVRILAESAKEASEEKKAKKVKKTK